MVWCPLGGCQLNLKTLLEDGHLATSLGQRDARCWTGLTQRCKDAKEELEEDWRCAVVVGLARRQISQNAKCKSQNWETDSRFCILTFAF
jgi:hypothetical protein